MWRRARGSVHTMGRPPRACCWVCWPLVSDWRAVCAMRVLGRVCPVDRRMGVLGS